MSILIKGIEMPKSCAECPMGSVLYGYKCLAKNKQFDRYAFNSMQDWCPLIEIPPHGRLIDADAFTKDECNYCDGACEALPCDCLNCKSDCRCDFMKDIADAPTIIPEEDE